MNDSVVGLPQSDPGADIFDSWPQGDPNECWRQRRIHAEEVFRLNMGLAVAAWEQSAHELLRLNHLDHPCAPIAPSFRLRNHELFVIGVAENLKIFLAMSLGAYASWLIESRVPIIEAIPRLQTYMVALAEETRLAKWQAMLAETHLNELPKFEGWEIEAENLYDVDVVPSMNSSFQELCDQILSAPDEAIDVVDVQPNVELSFEEAVKKLEDWRLSAGPDGSKLTWKEVAGKLGMKWNGADRDLRKARGNNRAPKDHIDRIVRFVKRLE